MFTAVCVGNSVTCYDITSFETTCGVVGFYCCCKYTAYRRNITLFFYKNFVLKYFWFEIVRISLTCS